MALSCSWSSRQHGLHCQSFLSAFDLDRYLFTNFFGPQDIEGLIEIVDCYVADRYQLVTDLVSRFFGGTFGHDLSHICFTIAVRSNESEESREGFRPLSNVLTIDNGKDGVGRSSLPIETDASHVARGEPLG